MVRTYLLDVGFGNLGTLESLLIEVSSYQGRIDKTKSLNTNDQVLFVPGNGNWTTYCQNVGSLEGLISEGKEFHVFGVCGGMQMLLGKSDEGPETGLEIYMGACKLIKGPAEPNVGFRYLPSIGSVYFLNNYGVEKYAGNKFSDNIDEWGAYDILGKEFISYIFGNRFSGCQFHPEVSSVAGKEFIKRYLAFVEQKSLG